MRKTALLSTVISMLLMVAAFTALVNAESYTWDGVNFVEGIYGQSPIRYPHPNRDYYAISPYVAWNMNGLKLSHNQVDRALSMIVIGSATAVCSVVGAAVGAQMGGVHSAVVGAVLGAALGLTITYVSDAFLDEHNCIWWWVSTELIEQLSTWATIIALYSVTNPTIARNIVFNLLAEYGYLRLGPVTFIDAISIGNPAPGDTQTLFISTTTGGTTNPAPGTYYYGYGESVTVSIIVNTNYDFDYWLLDGATYYGNPITVTMDSDHTLTAYFKYDPGGGCPTLFVWNGTGYAEEGILDIHAESDVTLQHEIQNTLALDKGVYKLQLRELDNFTSHIDQVRLYAVDDKGEWHSCPLTHAYHNELGNVKGKLRSDDDVRVDLKPTEIISVEFAQPIPYSKTAYFIFEINGYNRKPLMK